MTNRALNAEGAGLLRKIADGGGFAFVALAERAESDDARAAEALQEMAWEQLHSGPWHAVEPVWRDAYSLSCLHLARIRYASGDVRAALRILDLGLLMGGSLLRSDLDHSVSVLSRLAAGATAAGDSNRSPSPSAGGVDAADEGGSRGCVDDADVLFHSPLVSHCYGNLGRELLLLLKLEFSGCLFSRIETNIWISGHLVLHLIKILKSFETGRIEIKIPLVIFFTLFPKLFGFCGVPTNLIVLSDPSSVKFKVSSEFGDLWLFIVRN